jgi:hypothetical protein
MFVSTKDEERVRLSKKHMKGEKGKEKQGSGEPLGGENKQAACYYLSKLA